MTPSKAPRVERQAPRGLIVCDASDEVTKRVATQLARDSKFDVDCIEATDRPSWTRYLPSAIERLVDTPEVTWDKDPSNYDLVIVGTLVTSGAVSAPIRQYLHRNAGTLSTVAFYCVEANRGGWKALREMALVSGRNPAAMLLTTTLDVQWRRHREQARRFLDTLFDVAPLPAATIHQLGVSPAVSHEAA